MHIKDFDSYEFSKREINGVPVYYKNMPWAPCINIRVVFNTGAFNDPIGKEGLSHFLEHMIFDGSPMLTDKKSIREWSKRNALNTWHAWTNFYNTCYWLKCLPEKYTNTLSGMKDMIFNSYLRSEDIEHERKVIIQEAWNKFSNDKYLKYCKDFLKNIFIGHTHERFETALGWPDTISKISQEDIKIWHKENYGIGNFYIVLSGAVEEKHIDELKTFLKDLPTVSVSSQKESSDTFNKPLQQKIIKTADEIGEVKEQVEISLYRVGKNKTYIEEEVKNIFQRFIHDLLHERLRTENGICYSLKVNIWNQNTFFQLFLNVKTEEKNIELVEKEVGNIMGEIINKKCENKFDIIKKLYIEQLKSTETYSSEITDNVLNRISKFAGHITTEKEQLVMAEKVSYEDIVQFTKWAFDPEYLFTEIILPSRKS
jgi:predicted Zn-dependent peptidase